MYHNEKVEALDAQIAELSGHMHAATYRLLVLIREFDTLKAYLDCGFNSTAHWLNFRIGLDMGAGREKVRVAHALSSLPVLSAALQSGAVSYSKIRALTRIAKPETEEALLNAARFSTAKHIERLVRSYRRVSRYDAVQQEAQRYFSMRFDADGMLVVEGRFLPDEGAFLMKAIEAQDKPTQADALMALLSASTQQQVEVTVHVDAEVLADPTAAGRAEIEGEGVAPETCRRLCCDASIITMAHGSDGRVLDVGRKTRKISAPLKRALFERDNGCCRFPGCTHKFVDGHHIRHWIDGGVTSLANLTSLCRFHHRLVHEHGYSVDASFVFRDPNGDVVRSAGEVPPLQGDLATSNQSANIVPIEQQCWEGHRFDYGLVIAGLFWSEQRHQSDQDELIAIAA